MMQKSNSLATSYVAMHNFSGNASESQLTFNKGETVFADAGQSGDWWWGAMSRSGVKVEGWFPPTYVRKRAKSVSAAQPAAAPVMSTMSVMGGTSGAASSISDLFAPAATAAPAAAAAAAAAPAPAPAPAAQAQARAQATVNAQPQARANSAGLSMFGLANSVPMASNSNPAPAPASDPFAAQTLTPSVRGSGGGGNVVNPFDSHTAPSSGADLLQPVPASAAASKVSSAFDFMDSATSPAPAPASASSSAPSVAGAVTGDVFGGNDFVRPPPPPKPSAATNNDVFGDNDFVRPPPPPKPSSAANTASASAAAAAAPTGDVFSSNSFVRPPPPPKPSVAAAVSSVAATGHDSNFVQPPPPSKTSRKMEDAAALMGGIPITSPASVSEPTIAPQDTATKDVFGDDFSVQKVRDACSSCRFQRYGSPPPISSSPCDERNPLRHLSQSLRYAPF